jgi:hypothetical protein
MIIKHEHNELLDIKIELNSLSAKVRGEKKRFSYLTAKLICNAITRGGGGKRRVSLIFNQFSGSLTEEDLNG